MSQKIKIIGLHKDGDLHKKTSYFIKLLEDKDCSIDYIPLLSVEETKIFIKNNRDVAILIIDFFFNIKKDQSIELINYIRENLKNNTTRIIIKIDKNDYDPGLDLLKNYDIQFILNPNDWELQKILPILFSSIRSYQDIISLEMNRIGVNRMLFFSIFMLQQKNMDYFLHHAAKELEFFGDDPFGNKIYKIDAFFCKKNKIEKKYEIVHKNKNMIQSEISFELDQTIIYSLTENHFYQKDSLYIFPYQTKNNQYALYFKSDHIMDKLRLDLLSTYFSVISASISTIDLYNEIEEMKQNLENQVTIQTQELIQKNKELSELIQNKKNLLRILYHDLNNTLSIMMPSVEMALELQPDQWNKNSIFLDKIQKSLHIQKEIIDQVRSLDAIRSGKQDLILKPVDLAETIHMSYFIFKDKLKEKNIHFEFILEDRFFVMAEPVSLSHSVIDNLISNAIKFSYPEGTIYVEIKNQNEWICLSVKDTGIGIPDYILENLFKEDCKTTRNGTNGEKGTGFGMPLVKAYVEEFGGKISISTKNQKDFPLDHGTTISLFLKKA